MSQITVWPGHKFSIGAEYRVAIDNRVDPRLRGARVRLVDHSPHQWNYQPFKVEVLTGELAGQFYWCATSVVLPVR